MVAKKASATIRSETMASVDTAWLRMERPTNFMMITGVLVLETPLGIGRLRQLVRRRFLSYPRFRQKPVDGATGAAWVPDPAFDLAWHVRRAALPGNAGKRELEAFVGELASTPFDMQRPAWSFHLVERYHGGSAVVARIHHCYADGIALMDVLMSLTDTTPEGKAGSRLARDWMKRQQEETLGHHRGGLDRYVRAAERFVAGALAAGEKWLRKPALVQAAIREGGEFALELVRTAALAADPPSALKVPLGGVKRVSWAARMDLDEVKTVGRAYDCTVNDVLIASAVGALRGYLLDRGEPIEGLTLRATVPVNLRPLGSAGKLGNRFGLVFLELPVGEENPLARLERIASGMQALKTSRQAHLTFGLLSVLGRAPNPVLQAALEFFSTKSSVVATNVPGPQMTLYLGGQRMTDVMVWVPQTCSVGTGMSIISYAGGVHFGLIADTRLIPDPDEVIRRFRPEFDKLLYLAMLCDWDEPIRGRDAEKLRSLLLEGAS